MKRMTTKELGEAYCKAVLRRGLGHVVLIPNGHGGFVVRAMDTPEGRMTVDEVRARLDRLLAQESRLALAAVRRAKEREEAAYWAARDVITRS